MTQQEGRYAQSIKRIYLPTRQAWEIYRTLKLMSTKKRGFFDIPELEIMRLAKIEQIGPATWTKIHSNFQSLSNFLAANHRNLYGLLSEEQIGALEDRQRFVNKHQSIGVLTLDNPQYPQLLKEIPDPPLWLFYVGDPAVLATNSLSIVGSRKHTTYAREALAKLVSNKFANEVTIVSGLAYGIDKIAHQTSLAAGGKTIAVLAGGLDKIYPSSHQGLAKEIVRSGGLLISEYPPSSPALPYRFPIRNRIIAGLSRATLIVEAANKSGTITTARSAIDYNRDLFAVPGDITRPTSEGCNYLIGQGAVPLIDRATLEEYYGVISDSPGFDQETEALVNLQSRTSISDSLTQLLRRGESLTISQLIAGVSQPTDAVMRELTILELTEKVYQEKPGYYKING